MDGRIPGLSYKDLQFYQVFLLRTSATDHAGVSKTRYYNREILTIEAYNVKKL